MVKRYNVKSEIDLNAWIEEHPEGVLVMASDYDDLRAQCGGMEMELQDLREGSNRLAAHKDAGLTKADIDIATLECDNEALQAELEKAHAILRAWLEETSGDDESERIAARRLLSLPDGWPHSQADGEAK